MGKQKYLNNDNFSVSSPIPVGLSDTALIDPFGRQRVSQVETIFDSKQIFDNQPLFFDDQETAGTGTSSTHSRNTASTVLAVSATTAGTRMRQTFMRFNYQPGKGQLILCTGVLDKSGGGTGITRSFGYYDDNNGIFLKDDEGTIKLVVRSNYTGTPVDTEVEMSNWNLDPVDGTGPSGITLDFSKAQILYIDFEWLGVGRVRIGFVVNGLIYYVHEFNHANIISQVYMSCPNLPIRYEISNDGTGTASSIEHICASVMSEGGTDKLGVLRHNKSPSLATLSAGTTYVVMAGRLKDSHFAASVLVESVSLVASSTNDFCEWKLVAGGTVTGTPVFNDFPSSSVQIADGAKTITHNNDGIDIDGGFFTSSLPSSVIVPNALRLGADIAGTAQIFYFVVTPITNNITVEAAITWRELN